MSLSEEKIVILKMLEEGKITSEEAEKLLDALENNNKKSSKEPYSRPYNFQDEVTVIREKLNAWKKDVKNSYSQKDFDKTMDDFAHKAEKVGKTVANTTVGIVDKVVDYVGSLVDTNSFNFFSRYTPVDIKKETEVHDGTNLVVEGINGHISVKRYSGDKIIVNSRIRGPENTPETVLRFSEAENTIGLTLVNPANISITHEILLPGIKFGSIKLTTVNGRIYAENSISETFEAATKNSHIELMGLQSEKISASTKNARIELRYLNCKEIIADTSNANVDVRHIKTVNLSASAVNGKIVCENIQNIDNSDDLYLKLKTSQGGIKINMNDVDNRGYAIKAKTTNGSINLLVPDLVYKSADNQNHRSHVVIADSQNLDNYGQKVYIDAETQNSYIEIVK
jgi:DUF4097 and DUF4098 domain-containing protein YvlB